MNFSRNATFTTLKGELSNVLTLSHDEYTQPITVKYFLAMLRHFTKRKNVFFYLLSSQLKKIK